MESVGTAVNDLTWKQIHKHFVLNLKKKISFLKYEAFSFIVRLTRRGLLTANIAMNPHAMI